MKKLLKIKCVFWFSLQLLSETFLILRRNERGIIKNIYTGLHVNYPLLLSDFNNKTWIFSKVLRKTIKYQISWKSVIGSRFDPCGRKVGRKERQTDRQTCKIIVGFHNSANAANEMDLKTAVCERIWIDLNCHNTGQW